MIPKGAEPRKPRYRFMVILGLCLGFTVAWGNLSHASYDFAPYFQEFFRHLSGGDQAAASPMTSPSFAAEELPVLQREILFLFPDRPLGAIGPSITVTSTHVVSREPLVVDVTYRGEENDLCHLLRDRYVLAGEESTGWTIDHREKLEQAPCALWGEVDRVAQAVRDFLTALATGDAGDLAGRVTEGFAREVFDLDRSDLLSLGGDTGADQGHLEIHHQTTVVGRPYLDMGQRESDLHPAFVVENRALAQVSYSIAESDGARCSTSDAIYTLQRTPPQNGSGDVWLVHSWILLSRTPC